jgi:Arc/MetJ family transcription regulator
MHKSCSFMHMRTTINIEERLIEEAKRLTGLREKTAVVHAGLEALIARESAKRLAALGGTERTIRKVSRRRARAAR